MPELRKRAKTIVDCSRVVDLMVLAAAAGQMHPPALMQVARDDFTLIWRTYMDDTFEKSWKALLARKSAVICNQAA